MADMNATTVATGGKEVRAPEAAKTGAAATRGNPARRSAARSQGTISMICIPGQRRAESDRGGVVVPVRDDAAVAKVVITRDPRKPIYICWNDKEGANLSVAIEAEEKE